MAFFCPQRLSSRATHDSRNHLRRRPAQKARPNPNFPCTDFIPFTSCTFVHSPDSASAFLHPRARWAITRTTIVKSACEMLEGNFNLRITHNTHQQTLGHDAYEAGAAVAFEQRSTYSETPKEHEMTHTLARRLRAPRYQTFQFQQSMKIRFNCVSRRGMALQPRPLRADL